MNNKKINLVVCSDSRTFDFNSQNLILDNNCIRYDKLDAFEKLDYLVLDPVLQEINEKEKAYEEVKIKSEKLLSELYLILNEFHNVNYEVRQWKIILGHWLFRYTSVLYNRFNTIEKCFLTYKISNVTIFKADDYHLSTNDSNSFIWATDDDIWNNILYSKILKFFKNKISKKYISINPNPGFELKNFEVKDSFFKKTYKLINSFLNFFSSNYDSVIVKSYLGTKKELQLKLGLCELPVFRESPKTKAFNVDVKQRNILKSKLSAQPSSDRFENFLKEMFFEIIPRVFIEGYSSVSKQIDNSNWPTNPKFIFTSNSFDTDEFFKIYAANHTFKGVPYIIGQHGSDYGTTKFEYCELECYDICDKFLTWGWTSNEKPKYIPMFNFLTTSKKIKYNNTGGLLLVENSLPHFMYPWSLTNDYRDYLNDQFLFTAKLKKNIQNNLIVKLHSDWNNMNTFDNLQWRDNAPNIELDLNTSNIYKLFQKNRLVVFSYDSTGVLEALNLNYPVMAFWNDNLDYKLDNVISSYRKLEEVGVLHFSVNSITEKINLVWEDLEEWWYSKEVQVARIQFINQFSKTTTHPVRKLITELNA